MIFKNRYGLVHTKRTLWLTVHLLFCQILLVLCLKLNFELKCRVTKSKSILETRFRGLVVVFLRFDQDPVFTKLQIFGHPANFEVQKILNLYLNYRVGIFYLFG